MLIEFTKSHGLGNDFVLIDGRTGASQIDAAAARSLCDRHHGIGADGVLLLEQSLEAPRMRVLNSDGSEAGMCGNGLRCFVKWLVEHFEIPGVALSVQTGAGPLACRFERDVVGQVHSVSVVMGRPTIEPAAIPLAASSPMQGQKFEVEGLAVTLSAAALGNPHVVTFDPVSESDRQRLGPALSRHPLFPSQANVSFARLRSATDEAVARIGLEVYERGCGWTQACGTAATVTAFLAVQQGMVPTGRPLDVELPGGTLRIELDDEGTATMTGPAVEVYRGRVDLSQVM
jgi:diaminopimelate epimerase